MGSTLKSQSEQEQEHYEGGKPRAIVNSAKEGFKSIYKPMVSTFIMFGIGAAAKAYGVPAPVTMLVTHVLGVKDILSEVTDELCEIAIDSNCKPIEDVASFVEDMQEYSNKSDDHQHEPGNSQACTDNMKAHIENSADSKDNAAVSPSWTERTGKQFNKAAENQDKLNEPLLNSKHIEKNTDQFPKEQAESVSSLSCG